MGDPKGTSARSVFLNMKATDSLMAGTNRVRGRGSKSPENPSKRRRIDRGALNAEVEPTNSTLIQAPDRTAMENGLLGGSLKMVIQEITFRSPRLTQISLTSPTQVTTLRVHQQMNVRCLERSPTYEV
jgi:hypothetical protein